MKQFDIRDFGAKGDNKSINTTAIQNAIDKCSESGGGRVILSNGTYITGTFYLKSNVEFYLDADAVLKASTNYDDLKSVDSENIDAEFCPVWNKKCLIFAESASNVTICGKGLIDCSGDAFVEVDEEQKLVDFPWQALHGWRLKRKSSELIPFRMIWFYNCENVHMYDIKILNRAASWTTWFLNCSFIKISGLNIECNVNTPNSDGLHFANCYNVAVSDCFLKCGDDCIVVRSDIEATGVQLPAPCENITVTNCNLISHSAAIRIGWQNDYIMRNCTFSNLIITESHAGIVMYYSDNAPNTKRNLKKEKICSSVEYQKNACTENILFSNIIMDKIKCQPIRMFCESEESGMGKIKNIKFSEINSVSEQFPIFIGSKSNLYENIELNNCTFTIKPLVELTYNFCPPINEDTEVHAKNDELKISNIINLRLNNVIFNTEI